MGYLNLSRNVVEHAVRFLMGRPFANKAAGSFGRFFRMESTVNRFICLCSVAIIYATPTNAQFTDMSAAMGISYQSDFGYMVGVSTYDFNKDGWDDLTVCTNNHGIRTFVNNEGILEEIFLFNTLIGMYRTPTWIDLDNDGDADFFATGYTNESILFRNEGDLTFSNYTPYLNLPIWDARSYGCTWGDYNNDSYLDLYISNYYMLGGITNWLLQNNGDFTFTEVALTLGVDNGVKTTYQSSFFDYDIDGDVDLLVTNDRLFGNSLYENNGDGTFSDVSEETNAGTIMEAMCTSFDDFDDDGDFDFFITNTEDGSVLLRNTNGVFENVADEFGLECLGTVSWGVSWIDHDNDTDQDIYVANVNVGDYNNDLNYFFERLNATSFNIELDGCFENDTLKSYSVANGDFDNNGFEDFAVTHVWPSAVSVWLNDAESDNHWIKVGLTGILGNADGIGATIKVYSGDHLKMKQITCGESFLAQSSQYEIFGIGDAETVDSLVIHWPGGWIDKYYNLNRDQFYSFVEGETFTSINEQYDMTICSGTSLSLQAGDFAIYEWSTGDSLSGMSVSSPGVYSVTVENSFGLHRDIVFNVTEFVPPLLTSNLINPTCYGLQNGTIDLELDSSNIEEIYWSNGDQGMSVNNLSSGVYTCDIVFDNNCHLIESFDLSSPSPLSLLCLNDTVCPDQLVELQWHASGGVEPYTFLWNDVDPMACGIGEYEVQVIDANNCEATSAFNIIEAQDMDVIVQYEPVCNGETVSLEYSVADGTDIYSFDFGALNPESVLPGEYEGVVSNQHGCSNAFNFTVIGNEPLELSIELTNILNGANGMVNLEVSGGVAPYNYLWSNGAVDQDLVDATEGVYSCIITDSIGCTEFIEVELLDLLVQNHDDFIFFYPNPCHDVLNLRILKETSVTFFDVVGRVVCEKNLFPGNHTIDITDWAIGQYIMKAGDKSRMFRKS